jgi:hypothetical protein
MFDGRWRGTVDRGPARRPQAAAVGCHCGHADCHRSGLGQPPPLSPWPPGHLHLAIVLLILTGLHDLLDGPVAKASGTSSVRGAFFDSVTDRVADALILGGVAWYLVWQPSGHLVLLPFAVLGGQLARLLPAGQGRVAGHLGQGRSDGAGRADDPARNRVPVAGVPGTGAVGDAGPHMATALGRFAKVWRLAEAPVSTYSTRRRRAGARPGRADARSRPPRPGGGPVVRVSCPAGPVGRGGPVTPDRASASALGGVNPDPIRTHS